MSTVSSAILAISVFSLKSQQSCKVQLLMEGENVARGQESCLYLVGWVHVHTVHVSGFLLTWAVALVVICMLKNGRYL